MAAKAKQDGAAEAKAPAKLKIRQVRSPIGFPRSQREVLRSLGLRRIRQVVEHNDNPAVRGMVGKIPHLVQIIEE
jgi:large subunit ribosomal protein L30